jgi:thiamine-phosphate pyrophosphorylase
MTDTTEPTRLFLVTPPRVDLKAFQASLSDALTGGDVAAVLIALEAGGDLETVAAALIPAVQKAGAAAIVADDTRIAGRTNADGVHVGTGLEDVRTAVESFQRRRIVGAGNLHSRHSAMEAGEAGADYVFFGRPHGDTHAEPHPKALELVEWWSEVTNIPAVVMAGRSLDSVAAAAATGTSFVALHDAVWSHSRGPGAAIRDALGMLAKLGRRAA